MPRQCDRLHQLGRTVRRRGDGVPRRRRYPAVWLARRARGPHGCRFRHRSVRAARRERNKGRAASGVTPVLELRDASVVKNDRRILDSLTLTIAEGEHTAIIGPNGAGKSALVSLLTHD